MKLCPFCGGSAHLMQSMHCVSDDFFSVACSVCECRVGDFRSLDAAENFWNSRCSFWGLFRRDVSVFSFLYFLKVLPFFSRK